MAPRPVTSKAVLTSPLSVSLSVEERQLVREAAFRSGQSVSAFMRAASVRAAERRMRRVEAEQEQATEQAVA